MKRCPKCKEEKDRDVSFSKDSSTTDGFRTYCKSCESVRMKEYNSRPEVQKRTDEWYFKSHYKLTLEEIAQLFINQNKRCAICKTDSPGNKPWAIDHDRDCCSGSISCGKCVRGILCSRCNLGLGHFKKEDLMVAYKYVKERTEDAGLSQSR